ncbi:MAG: restriction endonuclease subunit S [Bacteroidota bacterium]|jgi:type I restriction enzyme S subunit
MISNLRPYSEYKESGLPWVGRMPAHWSQRRMKFLFQERVQKGFPGEPLLAATQTKGVVRKEDYEERTVTAMKDLHLLKLVETGDFVISLRSFQGGIEVAHCRGIISPAYTVLNPRSEARQSYFRQFFKSPDFIHSLTLFVTGIREGQNIDYERLSRAYLPLPPADEQDLMGRFLTYARGQIERAIRSKKKLIGLLNEQKQAIIHRAVTRGLDPTVPLKPSGIPWLGEIPEHWEVRRLKSFVSNVTNQTAAMNDDEIYVALENVESWTGIVKPQTNQGEVLFVGQVKKFQADDVLFGKLRPYLAKVITASSPGVCVGEFFVLRAHDALVWPSFLEHLLRTKVIIDVINSSTFGAKMPRADWQFVGNLRIALPSVSDQKAIIESIYLKTQPLSTASTRLQREVELLREYRTRLVADVVTGKLDVREAAKSLPYEAQQPPMELEPEEQIEDEVPTIDE